MNYFFKNIEDHEKPENYPSVENSALKDRFKPLSEYLTDAKRVIKYFGSRLTDPQTVKKLLNSEDYISEVAHKMMWADWNYNKEKGKTPYSHRNYRGKLAVMDCININIKNNVKAKPQSIDFTIDEEGTTPLSSIMEDYLAVNPEQEAQESENKELTKKHINFLLKNGRLTPTEKKCLELYFIKELNNYDEVAANFDPPTTRQAIQQNLSRGLFKLKQLIEGTQV